MYVYALTEFATARLREEMEKIARALGAGEEADTVVSLLMDDATIPASPNAQAIASRILQEAMNPNNPDILYDYLLVHRRAAGLDTQPWPMAVASRVIATIRLVNSSRRRRW